MEGKEERRLQCEAVERRRWASGRRKWTQELRSISRCEREEERAATAINLPTTRTAALSIPHLKTTCNACLHLPSWDPPCSRPTN